MDLDKAMQIVSDTAKSGDDPSFAFAAGLVCGTVFRLRTVLGRIATLDEDSRWMGPAIANSALIEIPPMSEDE